ncbi:MAG TPA: class I SAM-dependent methyltransferase [Gammaproteobacteria bacterium]|nr:class I SAM-dependent methyltransferase [Gammaproteobacteria bacterium]
MMNTRHSEIAGFFNEWSIYQKVLKNNYMFHEEIYGTVQKLLAERLQGRTFSLLDLGCGDASYIARALAGTTIRQYTGFDLSDTAIAIAERNLGPLNCGLRLIQTDFLAGLIGNRERYDVIFTGFALHHLHHEDKQRFFQCCAHALNKDGVLIVVDTFLRDGETAMEYFKAHSAYIRDNWHDYTEPELEALLRHITTQDIPESIDVHRAMAMHAGFRTLSMGSAHLWYQCFYCEP